MNLENEIKQNLIIRGFAEKQLLNNRDLINATINEVILNIVKKLSLVKVNKRYCMECGSDITATKYTLICEHCRIQL